MEGIKEAIAYITGLAVKAEKPETIEINGRTYCTKDPPPVPESKGEDALQPLGRPIPPGDAGVEQHSIKN